MYLNQNSDCWVEAFLFFQCASWSLATVHSQSVSHTSGATGLISVSHLLTLQDQPVMFTWRMKTSCLNQLEVARWSRCFLMTGTVLLGCMSVSWSLHDPYQVQKSSFLAKCYAYRWVWFSHSDSLLSSLHRHPQPLKHFFRSSDLQLPKTYPLLWNYQGELSE